MKTPEYRRAWIIQLLTNPRDVASWRLCADWLEENGYSNGTVEYFRIANVENQSECDLFYWICDSLLTVEEHIVLYKNYDMLPIKPTRDMKKFTKKIIQIRNKSSWYLNLRRAQRSEYYEKCVLLLLLIVVWPALFISVCACISLIVGAIILAIEYFINR